MALEGETNGMFELLDEGADIEFKGTVRFSHEFAMFPLSAPVSAP